MTYFLEKLYELVDGKIVQKAHSWPCIRPCEWSRRKCIDFFTKKNIDVNEYIKVLESYTIYDDIQQNEYRSLEEWLIKLALEDSIIPDFEEQIFVNCETYRYESFMLKVIDLHTGKVLEDSTEEIMSYLNTKRYNLIFNKINSI